MFLTLELFCHLVTFGFTEIYFWKSSPYFNYNKDRQVYFFLKMAKLRAILSWDFSF